MKVLFTMLLCAMITGSCVRSESLMSGIKTPADLWKGYDPQDLPLDAQLVDQWEQDGIIMKRVFFTSEVWKGVPVRVYIVYGFPKNRTNLPTVLYIHGGGGTADTDAVLFWAKRGYAAASLDHMGRYGNRTIHTYWGKEDFPVSYGNWGDNPRNDMFYHAVIASMRSITFLTQQPEVNPKKIGAYGISYGGTFIWLVSALDKRLKCVVPMYGCGIPEDQWGEGPTRNFYSLYSSILYAPNQKCPILFMNASNDFNAIIDNADATIRLVNTDKRLVYDVNQNHYQGPEVLSDLYRWMDTHLIGGPAWPKTPLLELSRGSNGFLSATVIPDASKQITDVKVRYNLDAGVPAMARYWRTRSARNDTTKGKTWNADLPIFDSKQTVRAYCDVRYRNGLILSSLLSKVVPSTLGVASTTIKRTTLIDDFAGGDIDGWAWFPCGPPPVGILQPFLIPVVDGPDGGWAIGVNPKASPQHAVIATTKISDPAYIGGDHKMLSFMIRSGIPAKLKVVMYRNFWKPDQTEYISEVSLSDVNNWTRLTLSPSDFKSKDGKILDSWEQIYQIRFEGDYPSDKPMAISRVEWTD